jgi:small subunit ribosomal protein S6
LLIWQPKWERCIGNLSWRPVRASALQPLLPAHPTRAAAFVQQTGQKPQGAFMRHYEIVLLIHPDQSEQVPGMVERFKSLVTNAGGKVHRVEDWGRRQLAYMINKLAKAHYLCLNIECTPATLAEMENGFRFNDAVLRHLTVAKTKADTAPSSMMKQVERDEARKVPQAPQEQGA